MAARLQIPFRGCGAVLVARDDEQAASLPDLYAKALANGRPILNILTRPSASPSARVHRRLIAVVLLV